MPLGTQGSPQLVPAASHEHSTNPLKRVLVVDDDPRVRDSVGRLLMLEGMLVAFAENGEDAIDLLRHDPDFDLVLSDLAMPVLDGNVLCRALAEAFPNLPVILMTGQDPSLFPLDDLPGNPIALRKPIDLGALRAAIEQSAVTFGS